MKRSLEHIGTGPGDGQQSVKRLREVPSKWDTHGHLIAKLVMSFFDATSIASDLIHISHDWCNAARAHLRRVLVFKGASMPQVTGALSMYACAETQRIDLRYGLKLSDDAISVIEWRMRCPPNALTKLKAIQRSTVNADRNDTPSTKEKTSAEACEIARPSSALRQLQLPGDFFKYGTRMLLKKLISNAVQPRRATPTDANVVNEQRTRMRPFHYTEVGDADSFQIDLGFRPQWNHFAQNRNRAATLETLTFLQTTSPHFNGVNSLNVVVSDPCPVWRRIQSLLEKLRVPASSTQIPLHHTAEAWCELCKSIGCNYCIPQMLCCQRRICQDCLYGVVKHKTRVPEPEFDCAVCSVTICCSECVARHPDSVEDFNEICDRCEATGLDWSKATSRFRLMSEC